MDISLEAQRGYKASLTAAKPGLSDEKKLTGFCWGDCDIECRVMRLAEKILAVKQHKRGFWW